MYDANSAARRLAAILGINPAKKPMLRAYLNEAYTAGTSESNAPDSVSGEIAKIALEDANISETIPSYDITKDLGFTEIDDNHN